MGTEIELMHSTVVYKNRWMTVREDAIRRSDGSLGTYGVVEKSDFAVIAAVQDQHIVLVEQYRYPVQARHWELPQGSWEADTVDPLALAKAELKEETGLSAQTVVHAGRLFLAYGFCTQAYNVFFASDLQEGAPQREPEEQGLIARRFEFWEVDAMICDGRITDATTLAALHLLRLKGFLKNWR